ncbi:energy-coupling factor ABC transporter ATP-binding protein [Filifactor villosus]|uniref:ABC transporter ATP-binding protein n=1 Tax=Filifactor villosus TaxID=29374 RepID=A0ABV9QL99_9FIRM
MLEMRDVTYCYEDGTVALKNITMDLSKYSRIGIVGSNGAGKSTLFLNFLGFYRPTKGKVLLKGKELEYSKKGLIELRKNVGIVFQDPEKQIFFSNVYDDIAFALRNLGYPEEEVRSKVEKAMDQTGTRDYSHKPVHFLSFGQKKSVAIAGAIAMDSGQVFFDEPTAGLDFESRKHVEHIIDDMVDRQGRSVVLCSHDMDFIYRMCEYIYVIRKGEILAQGETGEIFKQGDLLQKAGLEEPTLVKAWRYLGFPLERDETSFLRKYANSYNKMRER